MNEVPGNDLSRPSNAAHDPTKHIDKCSRCWLGLDEIVAPCSIPRHGRTVLSQVLLVEDCDRGRQIIDNKVRLGVGNVRVGHDTG